jgi:hypothetical protein
VSRWLLTKRRFTQDLHGAISQNKAFFIVTAVKTSNITILKKLRIREDEEKATVITLKFF